MKYKIWTFTLSALFALSGCGGGGEDWASKDPSAIAVSPNSFNVAKAWKHLNLTPNSKKMSASGSCSGTYIISNSAAVYATATDLYNWVTINGLNYACNTAFDSMNGVQYYVTQHWFDYQGDALNNYYYYYKDAANRWRTFANFPSSAKVGDSGLIGVIDNYQQSDAGPKAGLEEWSYVIEKDTASTIVFNLIVKAYGTTSSSTDTDYQSAPIVQTEQYRYVVSTDSVMSLRSYDVEQPSGYTISAK